MSFSIIYFVRAHSLADSLRVLESGDFSYLKELEAGAEREKNPASRSYFQALEKFYKGQLDEADQLLSGSGTLDEAGWLKRYLREVMPLREPMKIYESEHFTLRLPERDSFLTTYAFEALEKAYLELGRDFDLYPKEKVPVEIYPTREMFSKSSTLSVEILDRSGAIGICKFRRLMILSPEQLAYGYRWLDTLSHEYVHYLINVKSRAQCPLWLHEGIAKYLETRWRRADPEYLTPGNRTELVRALKDNKLIPFARMEPSMVYLDNQEQVRQAFSQVSHAAGSIEKMKNRGAIMEILQELAKGKSRPEAFFTALSMNDKDFEAKWKEILEKENFEESPGASPDVIKLSGQSSEIDELVSTDARAHVRLGDRMKQIGEPQAALIQYEKALKIEPNNPVALVKSAQSYGALGKLEASVSNLKRCVRENPNYPTGFVALGREMIRQEKWEEAKKYFNEANALNPFNPEVHEKLSVIYKGLEDDSASQSESSIAALLTLR